MKQPGDAAFAGNLKRRQSMAHTDPVCSMKVDDQSAAGQSTYRENTYYFCS